MIGTKIKIKKDAPKHILKELKEIIENAFVNRAGSVTNSIESLYNYEFIGDMSKYGCLHIGVLELNDNNLFMKYINKWDWIDDKPHECCDLIYEFSQIVC